MCEDGEYVEEVTSREDIRVAEARTKIDVKQDQIHDEKCFAELLSDKYWPTNSSCNSSAIWIHS